ncbi:MAG: hypothetical protein Q4C87_01445 [Actinomycetaceae bacterium]|nr:hypothetical protein [Actinomycetaceae bacterium]
MSDQYKPYRPNIDSSWTPHQWTPASSWSDESAPSGDLPVSEEISIHEGGAAPEEGVVDALSLAAAPNQLEDEESPARSGETPTRADVDGAAEEESPPSSTAVSTSEASGAPSAASRRSETPSTITVFAIGIAAVAVALFFASQALGTLGAAEWDSPNKPNNNAQDNEYRKPEREAANPNATQGMGRGTYEVPTDAWLHPGYKSGVSTWSAAGEYIGVSRDKSTIVFSDLSNERVLVGYDVKTGAEKWRNSTGEAAHMSCEDVWNGIAYCSSSEPATEQTFASIDLATGDITPIGKVNKEGYRADFVGYWQGYTYWTFESRATHSQERPRELDRLIALKDQKQQWEIDIAADTACTVGDGALGCHHQPHGRVGLFNVTTGEFVAEVTDVPAVDWYRDGFMVAGAGYDKTKIQRYSWLGQDQGVFSSGFPPNLPYQELLVPISVVEDRMAIPDFVDPQGNSLLDSTSTDAGKAFQDSSTQHVVAPEGDSLGLNGDVKGTVYLFIDREAKVFRFVDENGKEVLSRTYGEDDFIAAEHGILIQEHSRGSVTVYAPQG